jgi:peptidoglycan/xylan/chitin deacetylase (PgdA/CDA1 family)
MNPPVSGDDNRESIRVATLLYHHVGPLREQSCRGLTVSPADFARQMRTLAALGFTTISPTDWIAYARGGSSPGPRRFMITFDDAYADLVENALPILLDVGFTATVFVPTSLAGARLPCSPRDPRATLDVMSRTDIAEWSGRGIAFGAHSRSHADLTKINAAQLDDEIEGSRQELGEITGKAVDCFAYPYGRYDAAIAKKAAGSFDACFTLDEGLNDPDTPLSMLRRSMVQHGDSIADVCLRAAYGKSVLERVRTAFGRPSSVLRS